MTESVQQPELTDQLSDCTPIIVLMLEDNVTDAELILRELRRYGLKVQNTRVATEAEFRNQLAERTPTIILADYHLPGFDGITALAIARAHAPTVPFIFVSGGIGEERAVQALREGATDYVMKDRLSRLGSAVERALRERDAEIEKLATEDAIRELMHRDELILESAGDGILGLDLAGRATFANRAAMEMTGWSLADLQKDLAHDLLHHHRNDGTKCSVGDCPLLHPLSDGRIGSSVQEILWKRNGEPFSVELTSAAIVNRGSIEGCVVTFRDLTRRRLLEAQLEQANRLNSLGRVAATIAHEVNNVLMGIQPFAEVLRRKANGDEILNRVADQITNSVRRGKAITGEILRYTQRTEARIQREDLTVSLTQFMGEAQALVGDAISFRLTLPPEKITVLWDPSQMQQVIANLISNARDAMPHGGTIDIEIGHPARGSQYPFGVVENAERYVHITIRDSGTGISPETLRNVFEPLFTTKRSGTGLGLALARQIVVERHNGHIFVESEVGKGTAFHLFIPIDTSSDQPRIAARKVILVEDELPFALSLAAILDLHGTEVKIVQRGEDVIEVIEEFRPDAVVMDISLPGIDGIETYRQMVAAHPAIPVMFSSGDDPSDFRSRFHDRDVKFLQKPYAVEAFLDCLNKTMSQESGS